MCLPSKTKVCRDQEACWKTCTASSYRSPTFPRTLEDRRRWTWIWTFSRTASREVHRSPDVCKSEQDEKQATHSWNCRKSTYSTQQSVNQTNDNAHLNTAHQIPNTVKSTKCPMLIMRNSQMTKRRDFFLLPFSDHHPARRLWAKCIGRWLWYGNFGQWPSLEAEV